MKYDIRYTNLFDAKDRVGYYMIGNKDGFSERKLLVQEVIRNHQVKKYRGLYNGNY